MDATGETSWIDIFFKKNFSVDECLAELTQKTDLETLRKYLKNYGTELQLQMSEILKNETEAIVNLAEYLTNLNAKIDNLSIPISQLREEIKKLYDLIIAVDENYNIMLEKIKSNSLKQNDIQLKLGIMRSCVYVTSVIDKIEKDLNNNLCTLERMVNNFSFQKIYLCELSLMTPDVEDIIKNVEGKLINNVNKSFLGAVNLRDKNVLLTCLRMYLNLQKQEEAHCTFRVHILKPELVPLFTDTYLEEQGQDLDKIYLQVKNTLDDKVHLVSTIIQENPDLSSFNFVLSSFWEEFDRLSTQCLPHVTAPGNPELFQRRFISTYNLVKYIAEKAGDKSLVSKNESFKNNLKRFNLPVYFEIKYQQIAGNFESQIFDATLQNIYLKPIQDGFTLKPSLALNNSVKVCFHKNIYVDQLADRFIKLSVMLLSRYIKLIEQLRNSVDVDAPRHETDTFVINCLSDLNIIQTILAPSCDITDIDKTIFCVVNRNIWIKILGLFQLNRTIIDGLKDSLELDMVSTKVSDWVIQLQNVTSLPRLYRRTNRLPPKEPSAYVVNAVQSILKFYNTFKAKLGYQISEVMNNIVLQVTQEYLTLVIEVLLSVSKTEEFLRRLKSRSVFTSTDPLFPPPVTMTDEKKIREQIRLDVEYFSEMLNPLAPPSAKEAMSTLKTKVSD